MHTFFTQKISNEVTLSEIESKHAIKVLRMASGSVVRIIDGKGSEGQGEISNAHPKRCQIQIDSIVYKEKPTCEIAIAMAPTKNNDEQNGFWKKPLKSESHILFP